MRNSQEIHIKGDISRRIPPVWAAAEGSPRAEGSALSLCSPVSCLLGGAEEGAEHSRGTTSVTSHTASPQPRASPLQQQPKPGISFQLLPRVQQCNLSTEINMVFAL